MDPQDAEKISNALNSSILPWIGLVVAILILAGVVHWIRTRYWDGDGPADGSDLILHQMKNLNRQGDLTDEEYRSIKSQVTGQTNNEVSS